MVTKASKPGPGDDDDAGPGARGPARQIWQAGLGAFAKAQEEGGKVFEALVREGAAIQRKTQAAAEERMAEATERMAAMAGDLSSRAQGQWGKLEGIFEERVAQALNRLGVPSAAEMAALRDRVAQLEQQLAAARAAPRAAAKAAPRKAAKAAAPARAAKAAGRPAARRKAPPPGTAG
ncbi:phasin family protein [Ramlibacter sp. MAHUQ-53]|uniref:phasin family protein n=1 Tax=unclassified Ramlibacter TaxID=2617605 RepID=UPI0036426593